jgi:hypothetical protein
MINQFDILYISDGEYSTENCYIKELEKKQRLEVLNDIPNIESTTEPTNKRKPNINYIYPNKKINKSIIKNINTKGIKNKNNIDIIK